MIYRTRKLIKPGDLNPRGTGLGLFSCYNICKEIDPNDRF
jgi:hypothetical protein